MRVLVRNGDSAGAAVTLDSGVWALTELTEGELSEADYVCISYAWGSGRVAHPFEPDHLISDRSRAVLEAVIRCCTPGALWIDAFCVPTEATTKAHTLRNLSSIYARAREVAVVLSSACLPAFHELEKGIALSRDALVLLDAEPWVQRFWTYQEVATSTELRFLVQQGSGFSLDGSSFLNHVAQALLKQAAPVRDFPALDKLIDVLGSWRYGGAKPFAYQVLAGMTDRVGESAADRFNAVLGVMAPALAPALSSDLTEACERFMAACEAVGDLSFIYVSAPRDDRRGRSWRPAPGELRPVLAWHTYGEGQRAEVFATHVRLDDMFCSSAGPLGADARSFIEGYLETINAAPSQGSLAEQMTVQLASMGFDCQASPLELEHGLLFPSAPFELTHSSRVLIASEVRWVHGAPALLVEPDGNGRHYCVGVGIFVGPVPAAGRASFEVT